MLTFVAFKWKPLPGYRTEFLAEHANTAASMVRRNYRRPHRFVLVTDDAVGVDPRIEVVPLWDDFADLLSPHGLRFPSCYRRLKLFSAEAGTLIGRRMVQIDLDLVVTGDLVPLLDREEDFVAWGGTNRSGGYNCSLLLLRAGTRTKVWDDFDPRKSPTLSHKAGCIGSDQGWLSYCLGKNEARFGQQDGVYSYRNDIRSKDRLKDGMLPQNARVVFYHGGVKPWDQEAMALPWTREHYC